MTIQMSDKVIYRDEEYEIRDEFRLEEYIHRQFHSLPSRYEFVISSTACHRGYTAEFRIIGNMLFLVCINGQVVHEPVEYTGDLALFSGYEIVCCEEDSTFLLKEKYIWKLSFLNGQLIREARV